MVGAGKQAAGGTTEAAFRALVRVFGLLRRVMEPYFTRHGISASQWGVLRTLHRAESEFASGMRLTDLGERLLVRPPSVTGAIDRLVRMGLVARTASDADRRSKRVRLTPKGRLLTEKVLAGHTAQVRSVMSGLDADEQAQLLRLLEQMASGIQVMIDREESAGT